MPATYTPVRYPGGKTKLYPIVRSIVDENGLAEYTYAEAFAGGAGIAMKLLLKDNAPKIVINDYDRAVYCMWDVIVNHSEELCEFIDQARLDIDEWKAHREIYRRQNEVTNIELGKAAFYLNRTNISGILNGGVIGGMEQLGSYKIDARFQKDGLKKKIAAIASKRDRIELFNLDAEAFINDVLKQRANVFAYFDPPYVQKGPGLYRSSFDESKHRALAEIIKNCSFPWMATYDDDSLVKLLYGENVHSTYEIGYSAYKASRGKEVLILPSSVSYQPILT